MINKNKFSVRNAKKILHKIGKHWVIVSAIMLGIVTIGATGTTTHVTQAKDVNSVQTEINKETQLKHKAADVWNDAWTRKAVKSIKQESNITKKKQDLKNLGSVVAKDEQGIITSAGRLDKAYAVMPDGEHNNAYDSYVKASNAASSLANSMAGSYAQSSASLDNTSQSSAASVKPKHIHLDGAVAIKPDKRNSHSVSKHAQGKVTKSLKIMNKKMAQEQKEVKRARQALRRAHSRHAKLAATRVLKKAIARYQLSVRRFNKAYRNAVKSAYRNLVKATQHGKMSNRKKAKRLLNRLKHEKRIINQTLRKHHQITKHALRNLQKAKRNLAKLENSLIH